MRKGDKRVAKFMVRYDGPYTITRAFPDTSSYTLDLPPSMNIFPTFHVSLLRPYVENDGSLFPGREDARPGPVVGPNGEEEWFVEQILDRKRAGRGWRYLVRWQGYGPEHDSWLPGRDVRECEALDTFLRENDLPDP